MPQVNDPATVAELTELYLRYEKALCENDVTTLDELFWQASEVVRFGATENLYGIEEIRNFRQNRPTKDLAREISHLQVVTFDDQMAAVTLEFQRTINGVVRSGRQSQMWYRFSEGWKIVSAHVSLLPGTP
ncbi:oxalurate catabolism protein HpxZ [Kovacikia minuta CCNUW1]|uniref:oxalurate catabolism protein HpxZ n=1 Tax=Kovacikia minuta TaxID=2931930 RepID=UPI001CCC0ECB|nr:oxalurate catabolism protein HpxZ [Kovacikia minuta]UBF27833.1 oxalurate catabolism protein HpxZ [Kovacikia minuta CCNUW1]